MTAKVFPNVAAAVWLVCCVGCHSGSIERVTTANATWQGKAGTAVTITQSKGTNDLEGAKNVGFQLGWFQHDKEFWEVADFTVPVMRLGPDTITLFFSNEETDAFMLSHLTAEFRRGGVSIVRCNDKTIC